MTGGGDTGHSPVSSVGEEPIPDWTSAEQSIVKIHNKLKEGQGVAVSRSLVMTALHGSFVVGDSFDIVSIDKKKRKAKVVGIWFEKNVVDVALLQLNPKSSRFDVWLDIFRRDVRLKERITVLSIEDGMNGGYGFACQDASIYMFDPNTKLCRSQYYSADGHSGCAVVTKIDSHGKFHVIGVHVSSHDSTVAVPPMKKAKGEKYVDYISLTNSNDAHSRNIHGHSAYSLICLANTVPSLLRVVDDDLGSSSLASSSSTKA